MAEVTGVGGVADIIVGAWGLANHIGADTVQKMGGATALATRTNQAMQGEQVGGRLGGRILVDLGKELTVQVTK